MLNKPKEGEKKTRKKGHFLSFLTMFLEDLCDIEQNLLILFLFLFVLHLCTIVVCKMRISQLTSNKFQYIAFLCQILFIPCSMFHVMVVVVVASLCCTGSIFIKNGQKKTHKNLKLFFDYLKYEHIWPRILVCDSMKSNIAPDIRFHIL